MALLEIVDALQALSLSDPEYLLFCPSSEKAWLWEKFDDIPRYLFRVFTPNSRGTTNGTWTKSMDASNDPQNSRVDIFANIRSTIFLPKCNILRLIGIIQIHIRSRPIYCLQLTNNISIYSFHKSLSSSIVLVLGPRNRLFDRRPVPQEPLWATRSKVLIICGIKSNPELSLSTFGQEAKTVQQLSAK